MIVRLSNDHRKDPDLNCGCEKDAFELVDACSKFGGFGNEFTFGVGEDGTWEFHILDCYEGGFKVSFSVTKDGRVEVVRYLTRGDVRDERLISF